MKLSAQQADVLGCIQDWVISKGYSPSLSELSRLTGFGNTSVNYALRRLEVKGCLELVYNDDFRLIARGIFLPGQRDSARLSAWESAHQSTPSAAS